MSKRTKPETLLTRIAPFVAILNHPSRLAFTRTKGLGPTLMNLPYDKRLPFLKGSAPHTQETRPY